MSEGEGDRPKPRGFSEVMREAVRIAETAGTTVRELAESVVESARELAEAAVDDAASGVRKVAERAGSVARELGAQAKRVVDLLQNASEDAQDLSRTLTRFVDAIEVVRSQLDSQGGAFLIGYLGEGGVGIQRLSGVEIAYMRAGPSAETPGLLRVAKIEGRGARLAAGSETSAYAGCMYGDPAALRAASVRRGADAGVAVAAFSFFRADAAGGWWVALNAGLSVGIPILSDLGAFEVGVESIAEHVLGQADVDRIEAALAGAQDRNWRRTIAESLI